MNEELESLVDSVMRKYNSSVKIEKRGELSTRYTPVFFLDNNKFIVPHDHLVYETHKEAENPDLCEGLVILHTMLGLEMTGIMELPIIPVLVNGEEEDYLAQKIGFVRALPFINDVVVVEGPIYDKALEDEEEMIGGTYNLD